MIVIDNAEELIHNDKINFRNVVTKMLSDCLRVKVLLTSRIRLSSLSDNPEQIFIVNPLSNTHSFALFKHQTRDIPIKEQKDLLAIEPDYEKYKEEEGKKAPTRLENHHFFNLLGGNP